MKSSKAALADGNLDVLFKPRSIAVLGASTNENSIGGRPIKFLKQYRFKGSIYPVNPKYTELQGLPCYPGIAALPEPVDLLIVSIRAEFVPDAIVQAGKQGIRSVMVISSGFSETGADGKALQDRIVALAREFGMVISGPNCQGFINHWDDVTATFTGALARGAYEKGPVAFCSQSGAMGYHFYGMAKEMGIRFSHMVSSGNEAMLSTSDYIRYVIDDDHTRVIACYMEAINNVDRLRESARLSMEQEKPLIMMKAGRSSAGSRAAASHTGSMAGSDQVADALLRQEGILRVDSTGQMFDNLMVFKNPKRLKNNRVAIVSISGGAGVVMADDCERFGLAVPEFDPSTVESLRKKLPSFGSPINPVDLTAQVLTDSATFSDCIRCAIDDPNTDAVVIFIGLLEHLKDMLIKPIEALDRETDKPILVTWMACNDAIRQDFYANGIPFFEEPTRCMYALGQLNRFRANVEKHRRSAGHTLCHAPGREHARASELIAGRTGKLDEMCSKEILRAYGIPVTRDRLTRSADEAVDAANETGFPVALKIVSKDIAHKSDLGGVKLNLGSDADVVRAYESIETSIRTLAPDADVSGIMVSEMAPAGTELLVGLKNDDRYGPIILVGLGGIFAEIMKDVSTRVLPINRQDAVEMLTELKAYPLLQGARGEKPRDIEALVDILLKVSDLGMDFCSEIAEMDINPLIVAEQGAGAMAADTLVVIR